MSGQGTLSSGEDVVDGAVDASGFEFRPRASLPSFRSGLRVHRRVLAGVCAMHVVALALLLWPPTRREEAASDALRVEFVTIEPTSQAAPPPSPAPRPASTETPLLSRPVASRPPVRPQVTTPPTETSTPAAPSDALQAVEIPPRAAAAPLFDDSGNIIVPEAAYEDLRRNTSDDRVFDYQIAGLANARKTFERKPPLAYEPGMFDGSMRPTRSLLTDLLERAVEASTASISIPIPGDPYRRIECKVVVLAAGGGCGMTGFTGYVEEDDPDTLNPEEEKQCAAWWEKITTTTGQQTWIKTRELYDANCRKPRETRLRLPEARGD